MQFQLMRYLRNLLAACVCPDDPNTSRGTHSACPIGHQRVGRVVDSRLVSFVDGLRVQSTPLRVAHDVRSLG